MVTLGADYRGKKWTMHFDVSPAVTQSIQGVSLPLDISSTLGVERLNIGSIGPRGSHMSFSVLGDVAYQKFSEPSADPTAESDSVVLVPRTTHVFWLDVGTRARFALFHKEDAITLSVGHSLTGTSTAAYSTGSDATSVSGWRFQVQGEFTVIGSFYAQAQFQDVDLDGDTDISRQTIGVGIGVRF